MDPTLILIAVALAAFVFFQFRSSKKRRKEAEERIETLVPGAEVMTNFGLYGTLISIDEEENIAMVEVAPKTVIKIHRQVLLKAVDPVVPEVADEVDDADDSAPELNQSSATPMPEPEFGERTKSAKKSPRKKPAADSE